jgi:hypothetical protein
MVILRNTPYGRGSAVPSRRPSPKTPEFLRGHSVTYEHSSVYRSHRHENSGNCRCRVEAGYKLFKFLAAYDLYGLLVGALDLGSPFTWFLLKCLDEKSLVLHERHHRKFSTVSRWSKRVSDTLRKA